MLYDSVEPVMEVPDIGNDGDAANGGGTIYLFSILRDGLSYLAACPPCIGNQNNSSGGLGISPLLITEFLHKIADTFVIYFGDPADESAVKDNFSTAYQLLEEMVDYGWPLTTEPNALTDLIRPPTVMAKVRLINGCIDGFHYYIICLMFIECACTYHLFLTNISLCMWQKDSTSNDGRIFQHPLRSTSQRDCFQHALA